MKSPVTVVALLLSLGAAVLAGYALSREPSAPSDTDLRLQAVEDQLSRVERDLAELRESGREPPSLLGLRPDGAVPESHPAMGGGGVGSADAAPSGEEAGTDSPTGEEAIRELVDEAVAKKARQMQAMRQKKPTIGVFAEVLELDDEQRALVEREVLKCQHEIKALLDTPTEDGTLFMDGLVEVLADGMAHPGKSKGAAMKLFGRIMSEKVPGSDQTYAEVAEASKSRLREAIKRGISKQQYATFESWQMDPSEIKEIPGSPWKDIERRVRDRAQELGADLGDAPR